MALFGSRVCSKFNSFVDLKQDGVRMLISLFNVWCRQWTVSVCCYALLDGDLGNICIELQRLSRMIFGGI